MKKRYFNFLIIVTFCFFGSGCISKQRAVLLKTEWLLGTWVNVSARGNIYECWRKEGNTEYSATAYKLNGRDTVELENIRLMSIKNKWYYIPTVKNQNGGQPIKFKAKIIADTLLVFKNLRHDFPQIITYKRNAEDSLTAEISGIVKQKNKTISIPMKRMK